MGRYYNGDIEGKFAFGCQGSDDGEYFGAEELDHSITPYAIYNGDIPDAIEKLKELIKEFNKSQVKGKKLAHITMTQEQFWNITDNKWFQDKGNGLLAGRIAMGLEIYQFHKKNPEDDIFFDADL